MLDALDHECSIIQLRRGRAVAACFLLRGKIRDLMHLVLRHVDFDHMIICDIGDLIGILRRVECAGSAAQIFADVHRSSLARSVRHFGFLGRILTLNNDRKFEGIAMCDRIDASRNRAIARAGRDRHGVGLLGPHGVESSTQIFRIRFTGNVSHRAVLGGRPTLEIITLARQRPGQSNGLVMRFRLGCRRSYALRICVIGDRVSLCFEFTVDGGIARHQSRSRCIHSSCASVRS